MDSVSSFGKSLCGHKSFTTNGNPDCFETPYFTSGVEFENIGFNRETAGRLATRYNHIRGSRFIDILTFSKEYIMRLDPNNSQQFRVGDNIFSFLTRYGISEALCQELFDEEDLDGREKMNERNMNLSCTMLRIKAWLTFRVSSAFRAIRNGPSANNRLVPFQPQLFSNWLDMHQMQDGLEPPVEGWSALAHSLYVPVYNRR